MKKHGPSRTSTARLNQSRIPFTSKSNNDSGLLAWYSRKLDTHPIATKSISSAVIGGIGDAFSQYIEARREIRPFSWDALRTCRFGFLGLVLVGPIIHFWYGALTGWLPGSTARAVTQRVIMDQFLFSPAFLPTFLSGLWFLEGKNSTNLVPALKDEVPQAIVMNWALWIPAQCINFSMVPPKYQVLFSNGVATIWNVYLSFTAHRRSSDE
jgi:hypothetical protein